MDYTIEPKLKQLDSKIQNTESRLMEDLKRRDASMHASITAIKADVNKDVKEHIKEFKELKSQITQEQKRFELDVREHLDLQDQQNNQRDNQLYNAMKSLNQQMRRMHFDIIDNDDNLAVTYVNPDGKIEYGALKKVLPDNLSIRMDDKNKLYVNYNFNSDTLFIDKDSGKNNVEACALKLSDGKKLTSDKINNDLNNATYNISSLTYKVESALKKLNNVNGYIASNNFKTDNPTQEQLTEFAIKCISTTDNQITKDLIPNGTKIKNTYNQHIWVLNRVTSAGLTSLKWEDFGSDNICVASNNGVHGLVTGSQDKFRGYIDINGVISINGLEEELNSILESLLSLTQTVTELKAKLEK